MLRGKIGKVSVSVGLACALCFTGCSSSGGSGDEDATAVQSVAMLAGLNTSVVSGNRFAGKVVSQNTVEVKKDADKTVGEVLVSVGDEVKAGDVLFTYDVDDIRRSIDAAELEIDKMRSEGQMMSQQLATLQKEKEKAPAADQLSYSLEIQQQELDIKENEYKITSKEKELEKLKASLENSQVVSEIDGIIQSVNDGENTDNSGYYDYGMSGSGDSSAFITIMQTGSCRVKGRINEQNMYDIYEGMEVLVRSRVDDEMTWKGTISLIDTTKADTEDNNNMYYGDTDSYTSSTKYAFYIELDSQEGLMIGQHVYIELDAGQTETREGIWLSSYYLDLEDDGTAYAWIASDKDKLVKQEITLGEYDADMDEYQITDGLTAEDYIAIPEDSLTEGNPVVRYDDSYFPGAEDFVDGGYDMNGEDFNVDGAEEFGGEVNYGDSVDGMYENMDGLDTYFGEDGSQEMNNTEMGEEN